MDLAVFIGLKTELPNPKAIAHTEDTEDLHVTLVYGILENAQMTAEEAESIVHEVIETIKNDIPEKVSFDSTGKFEASESSDDKDVIFARASEGQLESLHEKAVHLLEENGVILKDTFAEYKPHMTLGYVEPGLGFKEKKIDLTVGIPKVIYGVCEKEKDTQSTEQDKEFQIKKADEDQHLVFGWANVSERVDGEEVCDLQGDMVTPEELEKAAYEYVLNWHTGGEEHDPFLQNKCRMVESVVFTKEKLKAMGIPEGIVPLGWWIGFKVDDEKTWQLVKDGTYQMFSIAGKGKRIPVR